MHPVLAALDEYPPPILDLSERSVFVANLLFMHAIIIASEPLIEVALTQFMNARVAVFYREHLNEERSHAIWLAADLDFLGVQPGLDWRAAQIAGAQYYLVLHHRPEALLGYMAALECRPMSLATVEKLEELYGPQALRTVRHHAKHDIDHGTALLACFDAIEDERVRDLIVANAGWTAGMLRSSMEWNGD